MFQATLEGNMDSMFKGGFETTMNEEQTKALALEMYLTTRASVLVEQSTWVHSHYNPAIPKTTYKVSFVTNDMKLTKSANLYYFATWDKVLRWWQRKKLLFKRFN